MESSTNLIPTEQSSFLDFDWPSLSASDIASLVSGTSTNSKAKDQLFVNDFEPPSLTFSDKSEAGSHINHFCSISSSGPIDRSANGNDEVRSSVWIADDPQNYFYRNGNIPFAATNSNIPDGSPDHLLFTSRCARRIQSVSIAYNGDYILDLADPEYQHCDRDSTTALQCTLCSEPFTRAYNLRAHLHSHRDEQGFKC